MSGGSNNVAFALSADELNIYFTFPAAGTDPPNLANVTFRPLIEVCVAAALGNNYIERH
jgi:hypothetical protein